MNDNIFLDTNILVYAHTDFDSVKQYVAQKLITDNISFISTQVLQELANTLNRKFKHAWSDVTNVLQNAITKNNLYHNNFDTISQACQISERYGFSFYDSMIISAAINSNCAILFSEDMHDGQVINNILTIKNPFK